MQIEVLEKSKIREKGTLSLTPSAIDTELNCARLQVQLYCGVILESWREAPLLFWL